MLALYSEWIRSVKESFHPYFLNESFHIDSKEGIISEAQAIALLGSPQLIAKTI